MSKRKMIVIWLVSGAILTALFTAALGVFGRISILEHVFIYTGALLAVAVLWLLYRVVAKFTLK